MYEIWLMLNIAWEWVGSMGSIALGLLCLWAALAVLAFRSGDTSWRLGLRRALLLGGAVAVASFLLIPVGVGSSLDELRYWVDWAALFGVALGFGGAAAWISWPFWARFHAGS